MKDKEIRLRLMETLAAGELNRGHYHAMASVFEGGLKTLLHALEANPPLAEMEGYVWQSELAEIAKYPDGWLSLEISAVSQVCESDKPGIPVTATIRGRDGD